MSRAASAGCVVFALVIAWPVCAQPATQNPLLLYDHLPAVEQSSFPYSPAPVVTNTLFVATTSSTGRELFRTNGTDGGTVLVKDIRPGAADSIWSQLIAVGSSDVYFAADDGVHGLELWVSDGTTAGTQMVADLCPGPCWGAPSWFYAIPPYDLYFSADDGVHGFELWHTSIFGTPSMIEDIHPTGSSFPSHLLNILGRLFFVADDGTHGAEPWVRETTTHLVEDIRPGAEGSNASNLVNVDNYLVFLADDGTTGLEPWRSSYEQDSAFRLADIRPGAESGVVVDQPQMLFVAQNTAYFIANNGTTGKELWSTSFGASIVKDLCTGSCDGASAVVGVLPTSIPLVLFAGNDGTTGTELWKTTGIAATTARVADVNSGSESGFIRFLGKGSGTTAYFVGDDGSSGQELWKTDGTNTSLVKDIDPAGSSGPASGAYSNGSFFFSAHVPGTGTELWKSDGTSGGTVMVRNVAPDVGDMAPEKISGEGGMVVMSALFNPFGREPVYSVARRVFSLANDVNPGAPPSDPSEFVFMNGYYYFAATGSTGRELWRLSIGGSATLVRDIRIPGSSNPEKLMNVNGVLYFTAEDGAGRELWKSDGTVGGTVRVKDIRPGVMGSFPSHFAVLGTTLFFAAHDDTNGTELWKSNGSEAGTVLVANIRPGDASSSPAWLAAVNGYVFFSADDGTAGAELWKSNGTTTSMVRDINPGPDPSHPGTITALSTRAMFFADDGTHGREVWRSDGSYGGTGMVYDFRGGPDSLDVGSPMVVFNSRVWFAGHAGSAYGVELFNAQDFSIGGMIKDICPNSCSSNPGELTVIGSKLYFTAYTETSGIEPWVSQGTAATTVLLSDIDPGIAPSSPESLHRSGNLLYFSAYTSASGRELWVACSANATKYAASVVSQLTTPGEPFFVQFRPVDATDVFVPCYGGMARFGSSDAQATLPADVEIEPGDGNKFGEVILRTPGSQSITIFDPANLSMTSTVNVIVRNATTTQLYVAPSGTTHPTQTMTFTAQVRSTVAGTITGTVAFFDGATQIGTAPVNSGDAVLSLPGLNPGSHVFSARYLGDANFGTSTSANVNHYVAPHAPTGVVATAVSPTSIEIEWNTAIGAQKYAIYRSTLGLSWEFRGERTPSNGGLTEHFTDNSVIAGRSYLYHVISIDAQTVQSVQSNRDVATTVIFTDDPIPAAGVIKLEHVTQLFTAANALRTLANLAPYSFDTVVAGDVIQKSAIEQLRLAISPARSALGLPAVSFSDPTLTAQVSIIRAAHITDPRMAVK